MSERTLVLIKPDGVRRGLTGEVLARIERKGLRIVAMDLRIVGKDLAETHYAEHEEKPFFGSLCGFMTQGPCLPMVLEGDNAIARWRDLMGATNPANAAAGTIRKDFASSIEANAVHGSDSPASAVVEIAFFFSSLEICPR